MKIINPIIKPIHQSVSCRAVKVALRVLSYFAIWRVLCPDVRGIECFSTAAALWWTLQLLGTPGVFATSTLFAGLAERGKEREWGLITGILSALGVWVILGASATLRLVAATISFVLWFFIALNLSQAVPWVHPKLLGICLAFSIPESTGAGVYGALALFSAGAMWKLAPHVINDLYSSISKRPALRIAR